MPHNLNTHVHLVINAEFELLLHWLDYHKSAFLTGDVWITDNLSTDEKNYAKNAVKKFIPNWTVHDSGMNGTIVTPKLTGYRVVNSGMNGTIEVGDRVVNSGMNGTIEVGDRAVNSGMNGTIEVGDRVVNSGMNGTIEVGDRVVNCDLLETMHDNNSCVLYPNEFAFSSENEEIIAVLSNTIVPNNIVDLLLSVETAAKTGNSSRSILKFVRKNANECNELTCEDENILIKIHALASWIEHNVPYVYYLDAYLDCDWGQDRVILSEDVNLLEKTDFNKTGHKIFSMTPHSEYLVNLFESKIAETIGRRIPAEKYHEHVTSEEHTRILNAMPYKKSESPEMLKFSEYMESRVSEILGQRVKIFNDDIWIRICRPTAVSKCDFNPCHRDIYLDFYRNIVNIYVPIVGSNAASSLAMESGSHLWNERDIMATKGGAFFKTSNKKYSVDAIVQSRKRLQMVRPNPGVDEFILFSPYLIHGCSSNDNVDLTRASIEIRFILDNEASIKQEEEFRAFLKSRVWR